MRNLPVDKVEQRLRAALNRLPYVQSIQTEVLGDEVLSGDAVLTKFYIIESVGIYTH